MNIGTTLFEDYEYGSPLANESNIKYIKFIKVVESAFWWERNEIHLIKYQVTTCSNKHKSRKCSNCEKSIVYGIRIADIKLMYSNIFDFPNDSQVSDQNFPVAAVYKKDGDIQFFE